MVCRPLEILSQPGQLSELAAAVTHSINIMLIVEDEACWKQQTAWTAPFFFSFCFSPYLQRLAYHAAPKNHFPDNGDHGTFAGLNITLRTSAFGTRLAVQLNLFSYQRVGLLSFPDPTSLLGGGWGGGWGVRDQVTKQHLPMSPDVG